MNLRYDMNIAPDKHPQEVMRELGIAYAVATPQSIADQWWFWGCTKVPTELPPYLTILNISPRESVGYGLSKEQAEYLEAPKP